MKKTRSQYLKEYQKEYHSTHYKSSIIKRCCWCNVEIPNSHRYCTDCKPTEKELEIAKKEPKIPYVKSIKFDDSKLWEMFDGD